MDRFEDKVVLVTGAAGGIGKASAMRIAQEGGRIFCVDVQRDAVEQSAKEIVQAGGQAFGASCDISNSAEVEAVVHLALETYGRLDSICNIAGILHFHNTHDLTLESNSGGQPHGHVPHVSDRSTAPA